MNPFIKPASHYKRDLNVVANYHRDMAMFLHKRTGDPLEQCMQHVLTVTAPEGELPLQHRPVRCLTRKKNGDRKAEVVTFNDYLKDIVENNRLFSPALTVYQHPTEKVSVLAEYIEGNIIGRAKVKEEEKEAEMAGNHELKSQKSNEQTTYKIANNSLSGGQCSPHTILYNKSAHSSLTSTCRSATSYGNANNEKFLCGNRHYWAADVVKANIISIINHTDMVLLQQVVDTYSLVYPSIDDVMGAITYSTNLYWRDAKQVAEIRMLVSGLTDLERAAFLYVGDLYHLAKHNDSVVRTLLGKLSSKATVPAENPDQPIKAMDNDLKAFVSLLCAKELDGQTIKVLRETNPHGYGIMAATAVNVKNVLVEYQLLIDGLWVTDNVPSSVAYIRDSIRRTAVTSDTDSTIFTVQDWVQWYCGEITFDETAMAIDYTMVYLASQAIIHVLAKLSTTLGVVPEKLNVLAMKNEYAFPIFSLTPMAKHYYAYQSAREGNVKKVMDTEIKGVYLKDSNCPPAIMKQVGETINEIMDTVIAGRKVSINKLYAQIGGIEQDIYDTIIKGSSDFLAGAPVNAKDSYSSKGSTPYTHYELWQHVFAPKYGDAPEPPYRAVRVSLDINNRTELAAWLGSLEDQQLAERFREWLKMRGTGAISSLLLPQPIVEHVGVPPEVVAAMNIRKLIYSTVRPFYLVLESLGIYMVNQHNTRLVSDSLPNRPRIK